MVKDIRRVVSGVDAQGRSVWSSDDTSKAFREAGEGRRITDLWFINKVAPDIRDNHAPEKYENWPPIGGLVFRTAEIPPHKRAPGTTGREGMHASDTVDLMIVISGEIWAYQKDEPEGKLLKQGDMLVQRGTLHAWENRSDKPCLFATILIGATGRPKTDGH